MSTLTLKLFCRSLRLNKRVSNHLSLYRSASRRLKSTSDEKQYDIPTTDQMRGKADPLHDTLQRTGDTFQATAVTMLSQEETNIYILKYGLTGFKLQSGIRVIGPIAVFPRSMFHWNVNTSDDINEDSLSLFTLLHPKPDLLVLGVGDIGRKVSPDVYKYLRAKNINFEILPTDMACATFNFLNSEMRFVVAGLIPPSAMLADFDEGFKDFDLIDSDTPRRKEEELPGDIERESKLIMENFLKPRRLQEGASELTQEFHKALESKFTKTDDLDKIKSRKDSQPVEPHTRTIDWSKWKAGSGSQSGKTVERSRNKSSRDSQSDETHTKTVDRSKENPDKE